MKITDGFDLEQQASRHVGQQHDIELVHKALHTGQLSAAKVDGQRAFDRLVARWQHPAGQLMTPGQAAHRAGFGPPLSGAMPSDVWEINLNDDSRDYFERVARAAIRQFNVGGATSPGEAVFNAMLPGSRTAKTWVELPASYRDHYERIARAAIACVGGKP